MVKYGGNAYGQDPNKKRPSVPIPGGLGDKRSTRRADELTQTWKEAGEFADPSSTETDHTVVALEQDVDIDASRAMAESDHENFKTNDELDRDYDPDPGQHTQYDALIKRAEADPEFGLPKERPGIEIQDEMEQGMYKRGGGDSVRKTWREVEDTAWTRWVKRWFRGDNQKKKGSTNPKY